MNSCTVGPPKTLFFKTRFPSDAVSTEEPCLSYYADFPVETRLTTAARGRKEGTP